MSVPITDFETLECDYAVEGAEWRAYEDGTPFLCSTEWDSIYCTDGWCLSVLDDDEGDVSPPPEAYVAVYCAALGIPTPQALAREMVQRLEGYTSGANSNSGKGKTMDRRNFMFKAPAAIVGVAVGGTVLGVEGYLNAAPSPVTSTPTIGSARALTVERLDTISILEVATPGTPAPFYLFTCTWEDPAVQEIESYVRMKSLSPELRAAIREEAKEASAVRVRATEDCGKETELGL